MPSTNSSTATVKKSSKSLLVTLKLSSESLRKYSTPTPKDDSSSPSIDSTKPTIKRTASQAGVDDASKPRGKPGPKKKVKVDGAGGTALPASAPKINPKANTGAINANLRALDRGGPPCRKWSKSSFKIKSFTGMDWVAPAWGSLKRTSGNLSTDNNSIGSSQTSDVAKPTFNSSAVPSEKSQNGEGTPIPSSLQQVSVA